MELVFNELSFLPYSNNEVVLTNKFNDMLKIFGYIQENYGFRHIVFPSNIGEIPVTENKSFFQWVVSIPNQGEKNKILSFIKRPFGNDVLENHNVELNKYYYHNELVDIIEKYCVGLAISYLKDKVSISLALNECWCKPLVFFLEIIDDDLNTRDISTKNIATSDNVADNEVQKALMYGGTLELVESDLASAHKPLSLRDDHGKDKLEAFAKKLFQSKYIISVISSLPFNPTDVNLVRKIYSDGKIELVLYWENAGYGMIVKTTGRNYRETEAIAEIIKKKYDK